MRHLITRLVGLIIWVGYIACVIIVYSNEDIGAAWIPLAVAIPTLFLAGFLMVWAFCMIIFGRSGSLLKDLVGVLKG